MKNLIIDAGNYTDIGGKDYSFGDYGCNYPKNTSISNLPLELTQGSNIIETSGDFYTLLGGSIENSNVPLYKWLASDAGFIVEISHILSSTLAIITVPAVATVSGEAYAVDYYGQPAVAQTFAIDSTAGGLASNTLYYTKYGSANISPVYAIISLGSEPILVNFFSSFALYGLNIQYSS